MNTIRIPKNETINKSRAQQLFNEYAILFSKARDAVPEDVVIDLFGKDIADEVRSYRDSGGKLWNAAARGRGNFESIFFYEAGFYEACSIHNVHATAHTVKPSED